MTELQNCPACGWGGLDLRYVSNRLFRWLPNSHDFIAVTCQRCGYRYAAEPLNKPFETEQKESKCEQS